ncbi:MAG TPA: hypothetical protein VMX38_18660 [Verrucomicrobiae bacterium]|nr:hypothetical protein [Verrucomicrobiae bacterium]
MGAVWGGSNIGMFLLNTGGAPYHLLTTALSFTTTVSGQVSCNAPNCTPGIQHTLTATASFTGGYTPGSSQLTGNPANTLTVSHTDTAGGCDPFIDPTSTACEIDAGALATCPIMGTLLDDVATFSPQLGAGYTLVLNQSPVSGIPGSCETNNGVTICSFLVTASCTNSPQWAPQLVDDAPPASTGWYTYYVCGRPSSSYPWYCHGINASAEKTTDTGPVNCPFYVIFGGS